jgi:hypothetical protein
MAAKPRLTYRRQSRLFALLVFGESFEASCRAIGVTPKGVRKAAAKDPVFAHRLKVARANVAPGPPPLEQLDWRQIAGELEDPLQLSPPPFDFGGGA